MHTKFTTTNVPTETNIHGSYIYMCTHTHIQCIYPWLHKAKRCVINCLTFVPSYVKSFPKNWCWSQQVQQFWLILQCNSMPLYKDPGPWWLGRSMACWSSLSLLAAVTMWHHPQSNFLPVSAHIVTTVVLSSPSRMSPVPSQDQFFAVCLDSSDQRQQIFLYKVSVICQDHLGPLLWLAITLWPPE